MARLVVFRSDKDVIELRSLLYGSPDEQIRGLAKCRAYEVRGQLPASVHTTCLLVSAVLGDVPFSDMYAIRLQYSMAIIRFVNETLDSAQTAKQVIPLHVLAEQCGLPNSFVELRHAATHEDLPSVYILRDMCSRALDWLYTCYWDLQTTNHEPKSQPTNSENEIENNIFPDPKAAFKEWRRLKRQTKDIDPPPSIVSALRNFLETSNESVMDAVYNRNVLVPAGKTPLTAASANVFVKLWMPLFRALGKDFCQRVGAYTINELNKRSWPVDNSDSAEQRTFPVLEAWAVNLADVLPEYSIQLVESVPRPWNARILASRAAATHSARLMAVASEMAEYTGLSELAEFQEKAAELTANSSANTKKNPLKAWTKPVNWKPVPIGVST